MKFSIVALVLFSILSLPAQADAELSEGCTLKVVRKGAIDGVVLTENDVLGTIDRIVQKGGFILCASDEECAAPDYTIELETNASKSGKIGACSLRLSESATNGSLSLNYSRSSTGYNAKKKTNLCRDLLENVSKHVLACPNRL